MLEGEEGDLPMPRESCSASNTRRRKSAYDVVFVNNFILFTGSARILEGFLLVCSFIITSFGSGRQRYCRIGEARLVENWKGSTDD